MLERSSVPQPHLSILPKAVYNESATVGTHPRKTGIVLQITGMLWAQEPLVMLTSSKHNFIDCLPVASSVLDALQGQSVSLYSFSSTLILYVCV